MVKWFDRKSGDGIIESENGEEFYVMSSCVAEQNAGTLRKGDNVTYNLDAWKRGLMAVRVKVRNQAPAGIYQINEKD